jgi:hypothetical protein
MDKCHICGSKTDYECRDCGEFVCDNCTMPYTQFSQIDYTLCKRCGGIQEDTRVDEHIRQEQEEKQKLKEKQIRNEKQRKYYYSEKAIEKRRLKKIELQELRAKQRVESAEILAAIFKDMFKYM